MKHLQGRVAVVTGAAGGIGRATSVALAQKGCRLAISDVDLDGLQVTADTIRAAGGQVCMHEVDVADKDRMLRYVDEVVAAYGGVNILVNNAGVTVAASFEDHTIEDFEWLLGINLWGVIYGCKFFLSHLKAAEEAHIVNISSVFGLVGVPAQSSYCTSKFAVRGFSEALCAELHADAIGVTSVHPAGVATDIAKSARGAQGKMRSLAIETISKGVSAEHAADKIVGAIAANKMRLLIANEAYAADWLKRVAPSTVQRLVASKYARLREKTS